MFFANPARFVFRQTNRIMVITLLCGNTSAVQYSCHVGNPTSSMFNNYVSMEIEPKSTSLRVWSDRGHYQNLLIRQISQLKKQTFYLSAAKILN